MNHHFEVSDGDFERQFQSLALDPSLFSHEAHLRLAWIHIQKYGVEQAVVNLCDQIKRFANFHGDFTKFNMTLTVAAVRAVYHFTLKSNHHSFKSFIGEFPRLKYNFKDVMDCHYGFDIYQNPKAKIVYLEPDLLPFD